MEGGLLTTIYQTLKQVSKYLVTVLSDPSKSGDYRVRGRYGSILVQDLTRLISSCLNRLSRKGLSQAENLTLIVMKKFLIMIFN